MARSARAREGALFSSVAAESRKYPRRFVTAPDIVDVFVYVVVLNLAVEYLPAVIAETFTMSLVTAVVLKAVLEVVVAVKTRIRRRFRTAATAAGGACRRRCPVAV